MGTALGFLFGALMIAGIGGGGYFVFKKKKKAGIIALSLGAVFFALFCFIPFGFVEIDSGEIAVVKVWGEAKEVKTAGLHFRNIITTKYEIYDTKTQKMFIEDEVYTKDSQSCSVKLEVHFSIKQDKAVAINQTYGSLDMLADKIESIIIDRAKVVLSADDAMTLVGTRSELSPKFLAELRSEGFIENTYLINIENAVLVDIAFGAAFEEEVEKKMIAEQEMLKADYAKKQAIIKAEEQFEVAKLAAEQALAKAKGEAGAAATIAEGQAKALKLQYIEIARMLGLPVLVTEIYEDVIKDEEKIGEKIVGYEYAIDIDKATDVQYKLLEDYMRYINYLEAWDGKLPQVIGDGSTLGGIIITP